jgi:RNA polymerase sigma-70 factor (ECF subfamily)
VSRLTQRLLGWCGEAEDVVQDVFVTVLEKLGTFRGQSSLKTWLTRITINRCRWHQRRERLRVKWFSQAQERHEVWNDEDGEKSLVQREQHVWIREGLEKLPGRLKEVMVLRYLQECSIQEIGEILKLPVNTVNVRLHRGRRRLGEILGKPERL